MDRRKNPHDPSDPTFQLICRILLQHSEQTKPGGDVSSSLGVVRLPHDDPIADRQPRFLENPHAFAARLICPNFDLALSSDL